MSAKKKINFDVVVLGSGLSSLSFIQSYLEKNSKIDVISPEFNKTFEKNNSIHSHIYKYLPPQMLNKLKNVKNYFFFNKFSINKNCKVLGSLEFGGLSNYWALQMDYNISEDIKHLTRTANQKLKKSFFELVQKLKLLGEFKLNDKSFNNDYDIDDIFKGLLVKKRIKDFNITKPILAYSNTNLFLNKKSLKQKINLINEDKDKLTARNYYNKFLKNKNIYFHNYVVNKIYKQKNRIALLCQNENQKKIFYAKKVIIGCGTLATTKLILDLLNIKHEVKIKHHPRLISAFLSKSKIENNMNFMPSTLHIKSKNTTNTYAADFRPGNKLIINSLTKIKKYLLPFKIFLNLFRKYIIFSNIFFDSKYSNLFMKLMKNHNAIIYSKKKYDLSFFKKTQKKIFKLFFMEKLVYPFFNINFPGFGYDFHYFGTIPITNNNKKLSVNNNCQLKGFKNIYIIDGSVFNFKINKYPLGVIMPNASRIGKEIKK